MKRKIKLNTEDIAFQSQFMASRAPKVYLSAGFGAGKTFILVMKMFQLMEINRRCPGGLLAPSYKMYKRDVVPTIKDVCRENKIPYKYHKGDMVWFFPDAGAHVWAFSAEDPDSIKGPNLAWFAINEVALCSKMAVMMAIGRVRLGRAKLLQLVMSGTPEGFSWAYDYFIVDPRKDTELIFGDSRLNRHVAQSYFSTLEESYDPMMQEQYLKGLFVNLKGKRAAWAFNRHVHTSPDIVRIDGLPVWVSLDFNVTPMAATLWNRIPLGFSPEDRHQRALLRAFDEICIESSNTYEMVDALHDRLKGGSGNIEVPVTIFPDPAGRARSTKSHHSDFDILRQGGFEDLRYKKVIVVKDCLNSMNGLLGRGAMAFNSKLKHTVSDMEQCILKGNVFELDKSNEMRTHWLDGIKNMSDYEFPIKRALFREERSR